MDIAKTIRLAPGRYVVAVSGGVDSMVLLDLMRKLPHASIVVAHFDHGIRYDSKADRQHVQTVSRAHGLPFVYQEARLGPRASEDVARQARYAFLRDVQQKTQANGIITAHHLDDSVETAVHNILRGTGRKGMSSLKSVDGIVRPLLHVPKSHLQKYAADQGIIWREDSTNLDISYRRNYIRNVLLPKLKAASPEKYEHFKSLLRRQHELNQSIDNRLQAILHLQPKRTTLRRRDVIGLPHAVGSELVAEWLRSNKKRQLSRKLIERLLNAFKTAQPQTEFVLDGTSKVIFTKQLAKFSTEL